MQQNFEGFSEVTRAKEKSISALTQEAQIYQRS